MSSSSYFPGHGFVGEAGNSSLVLLPPVVQEISSHAPETRYILAGVDGFLGRVVLSLQNTTFLQEDRKVDGIPAFLAAARVVAAAEMDLELPSSETDKYIDADIHAARSDPELITGMVLHARPSAFHEAVLRADTTELDERIALYTLDGLKAFWESMYTVAPDEMEAIAGRGPGAVLKRLGVISNRKSKVSMLENSGVFKPADAQPLSEQTLSSILGTDQIVVQSETGNILGSSLTQQRLERWAALNMQYDAEVIVPSEVGKQAAEPLFRGAILGGDDDRGHRTRERMKLLGIERMLQNARAAFRQERNLGGPAEITPYHFQLEALYAALLAKAKLDSHESSEENIALELGLTIQGMNILLTESDQSEDQPSNPSSEFMSTNNDSYGQTEFQRDIGIAGTVYALLRKHRGKEYAVSHLTRLCDQLSGRISLDSSDSHGSSGAVAVLDEIYGSDIRGGMTAGNYEAVAGQAMLHLAAAPDPLDRKIAGEALRAGAARRTDRYGRYRQRSARAERDAASEQRREDFNGRGRVLNFYGSMGGRYREADGSTGGMEAVLFALGAFEQIDSAGIRSPMRDSLIRGQLEKAAQQQGRVIEINEPFGVVPDDYQCEMANYFGRLPEEMDAGDILRPVIDNGLITLSYTSNRESGLIERLLQSDERFFDWRIWPTDLIRFLKTETNQPTYDIGHADPRWKWTEKTVVLFMRKDKHTPSDLIRFLVQSAAANNTTKLFDGFIEA